jgi:hypothetical protein
VFDPTSRYYDVEDATLVVQEGGAERRVSYKRRRFVPQSSDLTVVAEHTFVSGERLDNVTARYAGDPRLFWQLCDANVVLRPGELEEVGRIVRIALRGL